MASLRREPTWPPPPPDQHDNVPAALLIGHYICSEQRNPPTPLGSPIYAVLDATVHRSNPSLYAEFIGDTDTICTHDKILVAKTSARAMRLRYRLAHAGVLLPTKTLGVRHPSNLPE